jgi:DNA primase
LGRIPDEIIQQVRDRVDLVDLVGRHITLKQSGRNHKGLCPFHGEKTPSFNVNSDRQVFHCFGCSAGGNAFDFLMQMENLTFPEAVRTLAAQVGVQVPETGPGGGGVAERLYEANALALEHYRKALVGPALEYLVGRGLDAETIERFEIGFAPERWDFIASVLRAKRIPAELGERAGLLASRSSGGHYDRLRGRIVFPIRDVRGRVLGFGGRALGAEQEPKYLNTPESPIFRKREAFFGFPHALEAIRRSERVVVVEGYFDLLALHRAGIAEALATCGTALTPEHARNLRRRTREVVMLFDGDEAGQRAAERSLEVLLPEELRVRAAVLPPGDDPDSLLERDGAEALRACLDASQPAFDLVIGRAVARGCSTPWEKADAVAAVVPLLALVKSAVERAEIVRQLALAAGTEPHHVEAALRAAARGEDAREAMPVAPRIQDETADRFLRGIARSLVEHPHLGRMIPRDEFETLVPALPLAELVATLIDAAAEPRPVNLEEIGGRLRDEARAVLHALLAAEEGPPDEETAARTIEDTIERLRLRRLKQRQRQLTSRLSDPAADPDSILREKDDTRRQTVKLAPPGSPH